MPRRAHVLTAGGGRRSSALRAPDGDHILVANEWAIRAVPTVWRTVGSAAGDEREIHVGDLAGGRFLGLVEVDVTIDEQQSRRDARLTAGRALRQARRCNRRPRTTGTSLWLADRRDGRAQCNGGLPECGAVQETRPGIAPPVVRRGRLDTSGIARARRRSSNPARRSASQAAVRRPRGSQP